MEPLSAHLGIMSPSLIPTTDQIDWMVAVIREGIIEVLRPLTAEGLWKPTR